jgi:hypothetical protein
MIVRALRRRLAAGFFALRFTDFLLFPAAILFD